MIKSFVHKGLEAFFHSGSRKGIQPVHAAKLRIQLAVLNQAQIAADLDVSGWRLHALKGDLKGFYAITVNANWRIIFRFIGTDVELVDYLDYH
jgi:toxin HigB-1